MAQVDAMPITFEVNREDDYYTARVIGQITDEELCIAWEDFLYGQEWAPGMAEFTDLSQADMCKLSADGIERLAKLINGIYQANGVLESKCSVFAPGNLPYGLSRMYAAFSENYPETVRVFRKKIDALKWLLER